MPKARVFAVGEAEVASASTTRRFNVDVAAMAGEQIFGPLQVEGMPLIGAHVVQSGGNPITIYLESSVDDLQVNTPRWDLLTAVVVSPGISIPFFVQPSTLNGRYPTKYIRARVNEPTTGAYTAALILFGTQ